jgi:hypothetical protein
VRKLAEYVTCRSKESFDYFPDIAISTAQKQSRSAKIITSKLELGFANKNATITNSNSKINSTVKAFVVRLAEAFDELASKPHSTGAACPSL